VLFVRSLFQEAGEREKNRLGIRGLRCSPTIREPGTGSVTVYEIQEWHGLWPLDSEVVYYIYG